MLNPQGVSGAGWLEPWEPPSLAVGGILLGCFFVNLFASE